MIEERKIYNEINRPIYWTVDKLHIIQQVYPKAKTTKTGMIMTNYGKNQVSWLDLFSQEIKFLPFQSFCRYINRLYGYSAEDLASQLIFGDRNVRPFDASTKEPCKFHNLTDGYRKHSSWASHTKESQGNRAKDPIERAKMRICGSYNYTLSIAKTVPEMYFYLSTMSDSMDIKFGVTKYSDLDKRRNFGHDDFDGTNYERMALLASGNSFDICRMERDYKMKYLNTEERIKPDQVEDLIQFVSTYSDNINVFDVSGFICR